MACKTSWTRRKIRRRFARVDAALKQRPAHRCCRFGVARNTLSANRRRTGYGQTLGWSALLQSRLCPVDGAGDVLDWSGTDRSLEESKSTRTSDQIALGVCYQRCECGDTAVCFWSVETTR